jgi:hypothetical protein
MNTFTWCGGPLYCKVRRTKKPENQGNKYNIESPLFEKSHLETGDFKIEKKTVGES